MDDVLVMVGGGLFQMRADAAPKARLPTVFILVPGTISLLDDDDIGCQHSTILQQSE